MTEAHNSLEDFPLHADSPDPVARHDEAALPASRRAAPLPVRATAAAADGAVILLLTAIAVLGARLATGHAPRPEGLPWAAAFVVYLSLFATIPPLVLFGRTIGMAIADVSVPPADRGPRVSFAAALRRWVGTAATILSAGLLLLWTSRDPAAPTPADRLSGRPLALD
jgi:uncharacterized RDD family membrane protein YckC